MKQNQLLERPENETKLRDEIEFAKKKIKELHDLEENLKSEYARRTKDTQLKVKNLKDELREHTKQINSKVRQLESDLRKFQLENRTNRRKSENERRQLQRELPTLEPKYRSFVYYQRARVKKKPEVAFDLFDNEVKN